MAQQVQLSPGATVFGSDGEKVGTIRTYSDSYIVVEKGFFFPTDYYIPVSAIETYNENEAFLSVSKDDALNQGWDSVPVEGAAVVAATDTQGYDTAVDPQTKVETGGTAYQVDQSSENVMQVPVYEEQLEATKHAEAAGEVKVTKHVVTENETIEVPVKEERVRLEWKAATGDAAGESNFEDVSIDVPVRREVVDVSKRTIKSGELEVTRDVEEHMEQVSDSVRREVVDVDDSAVRGAGSKQSQKR
ncbi:hypothetical protein BH23CHL4_BH23CHL4_13640 [soil metagenome]